MIYVIEFESDSGNQYQVEYQSATVAEAEQMFRNDFGNYPFIESIKSKLDSSKTNK